VARWRLPKVVAVIAVLTTMGLLVGVVALTYVRRTRPPWPAVAGDPYVIELGVDGCPIVPERPDFVDAPGLLVPPDPTEVVLCTIPIWLAYWSERGGRYRLHRFTDESSACEYVLRQLTVP
jgi:hypothetical protein